MTVSSPVYLDTSALAKLYVPESDSEALEALVVGREDLLISDLALTELTSALARRVRENELAPKVAKTIYQQILRDVDEGQFALVELDSAVHRRTEQLLLTLGVVQSLRAADALHIALALNAGARALISFDERMKQAAEAVGMLQVVEIPRQQ